MSCYRGLISRVFSCLALAAACAGCANLPLAANPQLARAQQETQLVAQRLQEAQDRALALDRDNQELQTLVGQRDQEKKVLQDQVAAVREQLSDTSDQLASARQEFQSTEERSRALIASTRKRFGATINANNSLKETVAALEVPGVEVRQDGDVVRIELPTGRLFDESGRQLRGDAGTLLDSVVGELLRAYPDHRVGVEAHADSAGGGASHQQTVEQALAVFAYLTKYARVPAPQLFVAGHGDNHPLVSNATAAGRERNRRVELVVYPEKVR